MNKPSAPATEFISPSDLTFGLSTCKRCLWIKYWFKVTMPGAFPLVGTLADLQEKHFRGALMQDIHPSLRPGKVTQWSGWVKSKPLKINGLETRWRIRGKYDLVADNEDGTVALIDCKVSDSSRDNGEFYAPQLEAYAHSLENPLQGNPVSVATMGLLVWNPNAAFDIKEKQGFFAAQHYLPVERNEAQFSALIENLITVLEGDFPDSGPQCPTCNYLVQRAEIAN
ncbi:MAG: PD-(D/E)XK nuclease family protein [Candidatus Planktophila sp.]|jgi:hypothetical protein